MQTNSEPVATSAMSPLERRIQRRRDEIKAEESGKAKAAAKAAKPAAKAKVKAAAKAKPVKAAKVATVKAAKPAKADGTISLKEICGKLEIDPRAARRKLRKSKLDFHGTKGRWEFTAAQAKQVTELLSAKA